MEVLYTVVLSGYGLWKWNRYLRPDYGYGGLSTPSPIAFLSAKNFENNCRRRGLASLLSRCTSASYRKCVSPQFQGE